MKTIVDSYQSVSEKEEENMVELKVAPKTFHELSMVLDIYNALPKNERFALKASIRDHLNEFGEQICRGTVKRKSNRDVFEMLCYSTNDNSNRLKTKIFDHFDELLSNISSSNATDRFMLSIVQHWYNFSTPLLCTWNTDVGRLDIVQSKWKANELIGRICQACVSTLIRACKNGAAADLYRDDKQPVKNVENKTDGENCSLEERTKHLLDSIDEVVNTGAIAFNDAKSFDEDAEREVSELLDNLVQRQTVSSYSSELACEYSNASDAGRIQLQRQPSSSLDATNSVATSSSLPSMPVLNEDSNNDTVMMKAEKRKHHRHAGGEKSGKKAKTSREDGNKVSSSVERKRSRDEDKKSKN